MSKLLIVDDSKIQVATYQKTLADNYNLVIVPNSTEAIQILKSNQEIGAIILNLKFPELEGFSLLRYLKQSPANLKILATSSEGRTDFEAEAIDLGIDYLMFKPIEYYALNSWLKRWMVEEAHGVSSDGVKKTGKTYPFITVEKCCYICGYQQVQFHMPVDDAYEVDWTPGIYPIYKSKEGYEPWDFLRSMVAVCPYCCFASSKPEDWADGPGKAFPYKQDAKKILSRTIATRKKLAGITLDVDNRFDKPARSHELAITSFKLAEKCMNGLILGEKQGTHAQLGFYNILLGCLESGSPDSYYTSALENFTNQLKQKKMSGLDRVVSYFFLIALRIYMGDSENCKTLMQRLSDFYSDKEENDVGEEEKRWLSRVSYVWNNGIAAELKRTIED